MKKVTKKEFVSSVSSILINDKELENILLSLFKGGEEKCRSKK